MKKRKKEKLITVIDHTGKNTHCWRCECKIGVSRQTVPFQRGWYCTACVTALINQREQQAVEDFARKKKKQTATDWVLGKLKEGPQSLTQLAEGLQKENLTKQTDLNSLRQALSGMLSRLKKTHPLVKIARGVYRYAETTEILD